MKFKLSKAYAVTLIFKLCENCGYAVAKHCENTVYGKRS